MKNIWSLRAQHVAPLQTTIIILILAMLLTACAQIAPAQLPPRLIEQEKNLLPTLSAPFTITQNTYTNEIFSTTYPEGWRVVSSASFAPPSAVFVSPDEQQIILITTEANATLSAPTSDIPYDQISQQKGDIWIIGVAPVDEWEAFLIAYEAIITALDS
ncbi:MAG: hypothetical protein SFZ02_15890 [bacterium]|nr:hypothetical protein [bacterium]